MTGVQTCALPICGEKADAYRFVLCQFLDVVDSSTGRAWRKCVQDLDAYIANHLGI